MMMHVDYSESYKNAQQDEIQSAYFSHTCFSLFTAFCYYRSINSSHLENVPITITSESSDHSRNAAFSCVNMIIQYMQKKNILKRLIKCLFGVMVVHLSFGPSLYLV